MQSFSHNIFSQRQDQSAHTNQTRVASKTITNALRTPIESHEVPTSSTISRYSPSNILRKSAQASTIEAHQSHCSMTSSPCTTPSSTTLTTNMHNKVNQNLAHAQLFSPKHKQTTITKNCCLEDNKQEGGSSWWQKIAKNG